MLRRVFGIWISFHRQVVAWLRCFINVKDQKRSINCSFFIDAIRDYLTGIAVRQLNHLGLTSLLSKKCLP